LHLAEFRRFWVRLSNCSDSSLNASRFRLAAPIAASVRVPGEVYTGATRLRGFLRTALLLFLLLSALAIAGRSGRSASLPVRAIRWFLGLDEADEFAIPLVRAEGSRDR
jgi:hypothetical protein